MNSKRARTNANTRAGYSSKTLKTWTAGEITLTKAHTRHYALFSFQLTSLLSSHRTVKCTKHNWKLNVSTMKYVNPPDSFLQDELGKFCHQLYYFWFKSYISVWSAVVFMCLAWGRVWVCMTTFWGLPLSTMTSSKVFWDCKCWQVC